MASIGKVATGSWLAGILTVFGLSLGQAAKVDAHGGDATKIHACVNNYSGEIKIVSPSATCASNWSPLDWNVTGPAAPPPRTQPMDFAVNCPGQTIQGALGQGLVPGDRLLVSGTCNENVVIGEVFNSITIEGQGTATINGPDATQDTINIRGRRILIKGFSITGGNSGINILRGGTAIVDGNVIEHTGQHGIGVGQGSVATIVNNTIRNNPVHGIFIGFGSANIGFRGGDTVASPNFIQDNGQIGIALGDSSSARIDGNTITGNTRFGINVAESSSARIGFTGIPGSLTAANMIRNNGGGGIRVASASHAGIEGNFVEDNAFFGILVDFSSSADIGFRGLSNSVQNNTGGGIIVSHSSSARISAAVISGNTGDGVRIVQASQADLGGNTINMNNGTGIRLEGNSGVNLSGNTGNNGQFGLSCRTGSYASGFIGVMTGAIGQKDFGINTIVPPGVTINSEDCIDRTFP